MTPAGIRILQKMSADGGFPPVPAQVVIALEQMLQHHQQMFSLANDGLELEARQACEAAAALFFTEILPTAMVVFAQVQAKAQGPSN